MVRGTVSLRHEVNDMIKEQTMRELAFPETENTRSRPFYIYQEVADGRIVPIAMGGLVEFALFELGGQLVDAVEEHAPPSLVGLN